MSQQFGPIVKILSSPLTNVAYMAHTHPHSKCTCAKWPSTSFWTKLSLFKFIDFRINKHNDYVQMNFPSKNFPPKHIHLLTN